MSAPIGCTQAVRSLWEFLDRGLDEADHRAVEEHLAFCRRCCGELEFAKRLRGMLRSSLGGDLPGDVRDRLEDVIDGLDDTSGGVTR